MTAAALALCLAAPLRTAAAQDRQPVSTLHFATGQADLTAEHRAALDAVRQQYPPPSYTYSFEGDYDSMRYRGLSALASQRLSERLAETRWQNAANYLGVPPFGLVHGTGTTEVRVYVEPSPRALQDSLAALGREFARLVAKVEHPVALIPPSSPVPTPPPATPAETTLAVARIEALEAGTDKWLEERWWESQAGIQIGILRVQPDPAGPRRSGLTLGASGGTPAWQAVAVSLRPDVLRLGNARVGLTPAFRWYDWKLRLRFGDDRGAPVSLVNDADPIATLGFDLDAAPWKSSRVHLTWVGAGTRVHAVHRVVTSYDQLDLRFDQKLWPRWMLHTQAVYDERFEKALAYAGGWVAYGWPLRVGVFSIGLGYVTQLEPPARTVERRTNTGTVRFAWSRAWMR